MQTPQSEEDPLYQGLTSEDLKLALQQCRDFQQTLAYRLFRKDNELAEAGFVDVVTGLTCASIKDFILREQAIGELSQIRDTKNWFTEFEKTTQTLLRQKDETV